MVCKEEVLRDEARRLRRVKFACCLWAAHFLLATTWARQLAMGRSRRAREARVDDVDLIDDAGHGGWCVDGERRVSGNAGWWTSTRSGREKDCTAQDRLYRPQARPAAPGAPALPRDPIARPMAFKEQPRKRKTILHLRRSVGARVWARSAEEEEEEGGRGPSRDVAAGPACRCGGFGRVCALCTGGGRVLSLCTQAVPWIARPATRPTGETLRLEGSSTRCAAE